MIGMYPWKAWTVSQGKSKNIFRKLCTPDLFDIPNKDTYIAMCRPYYGARMHVVHKEDHQTQEQGETLGRKAKWQTWKLCVVSDLRVDGVRDEPLDILAIIRSACPWHHVAELEEDVGCHGVDPHHEGGEGVEGEVADQGAAKGASHQAAAVRPWRG